MPVSTMAVFQSGTTWVLVILAVLCVGGAYAAGLSPAPAPMMPLAQVPVMSVTPAAGPGSAATDCMTLIFNMSDCLTYVEQGSKTTKPDPNCCPELAGMLDSNPSCLCNMLGKSSDLPVQLDLKKALKLPSVCGLQTPPLSLCSLIGVPVMTPEGSPSATPGISPSPMGGGEAEGGRNGVSASVANCNLFYVISAVAIALLALWRN